ncbi:MAG TPA: SpoIIE family protein phosphatase [Vicinamibacterales bacterium]|nr:SpoIIE family protein phosphatase [Vicinamibacterales bacterium]
MSATPPASLEVIDGFGRRVVSIDKGPFSIGRRESNDLRLAGSEVSRDHAEIEVVAGRFTIHDKSSRYGTFVNGEQVTERELAHGDRIRLGRTGGAELVFLLASAGPEAPTDRVTTTAIGDLRQIAALLEGLRALGSGRVLDDVLALVLDSAIEVGGAERGFIMLAGPTGDLEFKLARERGRRTLPGGSSMTSRKIPEEVFRTGEGRIISDLLDGEFANAHMRTVQLGLRNVLCVPLRLVRYIDRAEQAGEERRIGVLYLDSREKGSLLSNSTRTALETLATEAAVAIENARLYRETLEKARLEQEMRIAAEIQQALWPKAQHSGPFFRAAAASVPCRSIGGDFFDYINLEGAFGFALGDVAGKGPPAALLSALMQGIFAAQAASSLGPAATIELVNTALYRRGIESRFVTIFYATLAADGTLTYCNAGHNPPLLVGAQGVRRLEQGGPIVGLFDGISFVQEAVRLSARDRLVIFSDGVSEATNVAGEEYGETRILELLRRIPEDDPSTILARLLAAVREYATGAPQADDITAMVLTYEP